MPAIITLLAAIYTAGQITGRIEDQEKTLLNHNNRLDGHDTKLESHALSITRMEAWTDGYNAGRSK
jgi:hypothetical protein